VSRIALVGCGRWGRHVLRDLVSLGCRVTVVARTDATRTAALEGGAAAVAPSIADLPEIDGAVVVTPVPSHEAAVEELLPLDVPIFVEKPLTDDAAAARRLAAAATDRLFVMDKWRYHPGVELLRDIARSGELGDVIGVHSTRIGWGNPHGAPGAPWILAPHDLAIGLEILGFLPAARAAVAEGTGSSARGLIGLLGDRPWLAIEVSFASPVRRREVRLVCSEGTAVLSESFAESVEVVRGDPDGDLEGQRERRPISAELPLVRELRAFLEHLEGGPPPRSSAAEGAAQVEAIVRLTELAQVIE
jgi:predicted dehydrogenase